VLIELPTLIQEVLSLYALKSEVNFKADYETGSLIINGDPVSIRQVLHNLIKNALEAIDDKD